jgi:hypothetical protein
MENRTRRPRKSRVVAPSGKHRGILIDKSRGRVGRPAKRLGQPPQAKRSPPGPLLIRAPWGLGDAIYVRPLIRDAAQQRDIYLETPWPELYADLPVRFVRGHKGLRLQWRNVQRQAAQTWVEPPPGIKEVALGYGPLELAEGNVFDAMACKMPMPMRTSPVWDLPDMGDSPVDSGDAPLAFVRPVMRRVEWDNEARNPLPEYVAYVAGELKASGYATLVVCDIQVDRELLAAGIMPPHNHALTRGELNVRQLLATVRDAAVVVGPVGWIVPACIALGTPCFVVLGGNGGMNAPERLLHPQMRADHVGFAMPEDFCRCMDMHHECRKQIPDLAEQWRRWMRCSLAPRTRERARA